LKLLDKIWNMLGLVDTDEAEEPRQLEEKPTVRLERKAERLPRASDDNKLRRAPPESVTATEGAALSVKPGATAVSPMSAPFNGSDGNNRKIVIIQPIGFDDARQIAENLTNGKTVFVNFERADGDTIKRTVDFMSGITYAVGGTVQRISGAIFLFAPAQVEVFANDRYIDDEQISLPWRRA